MQVPLGLLSAPLPPSLHPGTYSACPERITKDAGRDVCAHIGRNRRTKLEICPPPFSVCRSGFSSTSCQRTRGVSRIRFRGGISTHISGRLASGRPGTHCAIHLLQFAGRCQVTVPVGFASRAIRAFFRQGVLDVGATCRSKGLHFPFPRFYGTGSYDRCASLFGCSTAP